MAFLLTELNVRESASSRPVLLVPLCHAAVLLSCHHVRLVRNVKKARLGTKRPIFFAGRTEQTRSQEISSYQCFLTLLSFDLIRTRKCGSAGGGTYASPSSHAARCILTSPKYSYENRIKAPPAVHRRLPVSVALRKKPYRGFTDCFYINLHYFLFYRKFCP